MLIDWFTVVAQSLNFLVLVWLLKRYMYRPVLAAVEAREQQIAHVIAEAAAQKTAAGQERAAFATKAAAFDGERAALLKQATSAADAERARLFALARAEADAFGVKEATVRRDNRTRLNQHIVGLAIQEALALARKVLRDLADVSLEEKMVALFERRLRTLDGPAKQTLIAACGGTSDVTIRSAFDLSDAQRTLMQKAVDQESAVSNALRFERASEVLCGVELMVGGHKLAWSMDDYLGVLENKIATIDAAEYAVSTP